MASAIDRETGSDSLHWRCLTSIWLDSGGGAAALPSYSAISASDVITQPFVPMARLNAQRFTQPAASGPDSDAVAISGNWGDFPPALSSFMQVVLQSTLSNVVSPYIESVVSFEEAAANF